MGKNLVFCFLNSVYIFLCRSTDTFDCLYAAVCTVSSLILTKEILFSCESVIITDCLRYGILV